MGIHVFMRAKITSVKREGNWTVLTLEGFDKPAIVEGFHEFKVGDEIVFKVTEGSSYFFIEFIKEKVK
jgi:hypothetical protein